LLAEAVVFEFRNLLIEKRVWSFCC